MPDRKGSAFSNRRPQGRSRGGRHWGVGPEPGCDGRSSGRREPRKDKRQLRGRALGQKTRRERRSERHEGPGEFKTRIGPGEASPGDEIGHERHRGQNEDHRTARAEEPGNPEPDRRV
jgi:hypothetical protein